MDYEIRITGQADDHFEAYIMYKRGKVTPLRARMDPPQKQAYERAVELIDAGQHEEAMGVLNSCALLHVTKREVQLNPDGSLKSTNVH